MNNQEISDVKVMLVKGIDGEGVATIEKTGTSGLVDTYTITYTDGKKTTFTVTNGKGISSIEKTSTTGTVDTYTITYNDNTTSTFEVTNGTVASAIAYDNTQSGLQGDTVQEAIDELRSSANIAYGQGSVKDALDALEIKYAEKSGTTDNAGLLTVDNIPTNSIMLQIRAVSTGVHCFGTRQADLGTSCRIGIHYQATGASINNTAVTVYVYYIEVALS